MPILPGQFQMAIFIMVLSLMLLAESFWPKRARVGSRLARCGVHSAISVINTIWTRLLVAGPLYFWIQFVDRQGWGLANVLDLKGPGEIILTLIVFDGFNYWWHRWNHTVPLFWRFHRAHHTDTEVDTTTALRFHPGELAISYFVKAIWILVWGPSLWAYVLFETAISAYSLFHHSNMDFPDAVEKRVRLLHITPRLHASHHTVSLRTRNANYSTIFSVWDRLFGSFQEPDFGEMRLLGLEEGRENCMSLAAFAKAPFSVK